MKNCSNNKMQEILNIARNTDSKIKNHLFLIKLKFFLKTFVNLHYIFIT